MHGMSSRSRSGISSRAALIVTCEHGGNLIPRRWAILFRGRGTWLRSHRGYDLGAAPVAKHLAETFRAPLFIATTSRLLVDMNRSDHHPRLFSKVTRPLPENERRRIVRQHYDRHRGAVERAIVRAEKLGSRVVHIAVHSFTPVLNGIPRRADVGLLYDPARAGEHEFCARWQVALERVDPSLRVRRNYPYRGTSDGFTTALRRTHSAAAYAGIEVELS